MRDEELLEYERKAHERRKRRGKNRGQLAFTLSVIVWAVMIICLLFCGFWMADRSLGEPEQSEPAREEPQPDGLAALKELRLKAAVSAADVDRPAREPVVVTYRYYDAPLSYELQDHLRCACGESGISMELALAVIRKETAFQNVTGDGGESVGYMQIQEKWHTERMERLGVTDLTDPLSNFRVGCDYLAELLENYTLQEALRFYNSGSPKVNQYAKTVISYMEGFSYEPE